MVSCQQKLVDDTVFFYNLCGSLRNRYGCSNEYAKPVKEEVIGLDARLGWWMGKVLNATWINNQHSIELMIFDSFIGRGKNSRQQNLFNKFMSMR